MARFIVDSGQLDRRPWVFGMPGNAIRDQPWGIFLRLDYRLSNLHVITSPVTLISSIVGISVVVFAPRITLTVIQLCAVSTHIGKRSILTHVEKPPKFTGSVF